MMFAMILIMVTMSVGSAKRIAEVLREESTLTNPDNPIMQVKDGSVDFECVQFKYAESAENCVLKNIDLHIRTGQTVGILGGTGASKTSLVNLISRLYDVTDGAVKVGGIDVRSYDLDTLRQSVAVVLQKNVLFSGTIEENLRWGNEHATAEQMQEVCRIAQADEFINSFADGYQTYLEEGGINLSGGQKQRLAIARALYKTAPVLVFDDSFSALDFKTDAKLRAALKEYAANKNVIIVAQRVGTIMNADRIIVLDDGKVVGEGTHRELMKSCAVYADIARSQLSEEELKNE